MLSSLDLLAQGEIEFVDSLHKYAKEWRMERDNMIPLVFVNNKLNWKDWEIEISKEYKDQYIKKIVGNVFFPKPDYIVREDYHLIDFNGDDLIDLVYAGREPSGGEIDNFAFFENNGDSLYLTLKLLGTIIEIERESSSSPINFVVWEWPCCSNQIHTIYYYNYYNNIDCAYRENRDGGFYSASYGKYQKNNTPNFQSTEKMMFIKSTLLPESISFYANREFIVTKDNVIMQTNPKKPFEMERDMEYIPEDYESNIKITYLNKKQKGVILGSIVHENEKFYFVKVTCEKTISELIINNMKVENILGWVNEKYLKIIK